MEKFEIVSKVINDQVIFHEKDDETKTVELKQLEGKVFSSLIFLYEKKLKSNKKRGFFSKLFKAEVTELEERELNVSKGSIQLTDEAVEISCSDKDLWDQVKDFDERTLNKKYVFSLVFPYRFVTHKGNIKKITFN